MSRSPSPPTRSSARSTWARPSRSRLTSGAPGPGRLWRGAGHARAPDGRCRPRWRHAGASEQALTAIGFWTRRRPRSSCPAEPALQPRATGCRGNPHPARCRQAMIETAPAKAIDCGSLSTHNDHVCPSALRHPVHPRPRPRGTQHLGGHHLLPGLHAIWLYRLAQLVLDAWPQVAGALYFAPGALVHQH